MLTLLYKNSNLIGADRDNCLTRTATHCFSAPTITGINQRGLVMSKRDLSQEEANGVFNYLPDIGMLIWNIDVGQRARRGSFAGSLFRQKNRKTDYWSVKFCGKKYLAHRVIWTMVFGDIPEGLEIDHEDGDGLNNMISNLRLVTHSQQNKNQSMRRDNKSGCVGIFRLGNGKYSAYINTGGERIHLGTHDSEQGAITARKSAETKYEFHPNHGRT